MSVDSRRILASKLRPPGWRPPWSMTRFMMYVERAGSVGNMSVSQLGERGGSGGLVRWEPREVGWGGSGMQMVSAKGAGNGHRRSLSFEL